MLFSDNAVGYWLKAPPARPEDHDITHFARRKYGVSTEGG